MTKNKPYVFRTEKNIFNELQKQAEEDGISLNSWMNMKLKKFIKDKNGRK